MRGDMGLLGMGGPERDCAGDAAINHSIVGRWRWSCLRFILAAVVVAGGSARAQEADHAAFAAPVEIVAPAAIAEPTPQQAGSGQSGSCTETAAAVIEETSESQRSDPACGHSANALINRDVAAGTVVEVSGRESEDQKAVEPDQLIGTAQPSLADKPAADADAPGETIPASSVATLPDPVAPPEDEAETGPASAVAALPGPVAPPEAAAEQIMPAVKTAAKADNIDPRNSAISPRVQYAAAAPHFERLLEGSRPAPALRSFGRKYPQGSILVRNGERKLYYFIDAYLALEFPIGVGRRGLQKIGVTHITDKRRNPTWVPTRNQHRVYRNLPASMPPGPKNPLGTHALNLTIPNYRIHGTYDPSYINNAKSDGCYRLYNQDIAYLFDLVRVGTRVVLER